MKFVLINDTARIPPLAEQVEAYLTGKGAAAIAMKVNLCLDELLTNTIQYGYADNGLHEIIVEMALENNELLIEIIDDALPFDPTGDLAEPDLDVPLEQRRIGGLGVHLAKSLSDSMTYHRDNQGRNHLLLTKRL